MRKIDALEMFNEAISTVEVQEKINEMIEEKYAESSEIMFNLDDASALIDWFAEMLVDEEETEDVD